MDTVTTVVDFTGRYSVAGCPGVAFYLTGYVQTFDPDSGEWLDNPDMVRAVMVGDDRVHEVDVADLTPLADGAYCGECGQIGCTHDGR